MGLWKRFKAVVHDTNEQMHTDRLARELASTMLTVEQLSDNLRPYTKFLSYQNHINVQIANWSVGLSEAAITLSSPSSRSAG